MTRQVGTVRAYFADRGYGFLDADAGPKQVFFHASDYGASVPPAAHVRVSFSVTTARKGLRAVDVGDVDEVAYE